MSNSEQVIRIDFHHTKVSYPRMKYKSVEMRRSLFVFSEEMNQIAEGTQSDFTSRGASGYR